MKLFSAVSIALLFTSSLVAGRGYQKIDENAQPVSRATVVAEVSDFDKAVEIIKKYEGLHNPKHWPLVGYGHRVLPGEKFSRSRPLSEKEADALLRKDLLKNCAVFRSFGPDSLLLGVLAYNIGSGAAMRSAVTKKLRAGNRDIYDNYVAHSKYRGKTHTRIKNRRIEEFEHLFVDKDELMASTESHIKSMNHPLGKLSRSGQAAGREQAMPTTVKVKSDGIPQEMPSDWI